MRHLACFAFAASLLCACKTTVIGGGGNADPATTTGGGETQSEGGGGAGGFGGAGGAGGYADGGAGGCAVSFPCPGAAEDLALVVPATLVSAGGVVEITRLAEPDCGDVSHATTSRMDVAPGTASIAVSAAGVRALAVTFFDGSGAIVDGSIVAPGSALGPAPATGHVLSVPAGYPSIQAAIDAAQPGDTVQVAAGVYTEHLTLRPGVRLQGAGAGATTLDGQGESQSLIEAAGAYGSSVRGFRFVNVGPSGNCTDPLDCAGDYYPAAIHDLGKADPVCDLDATVFIADNVFEKNHIAVFLGWRSFGLVRRNLFRGNANAVVLNHAADAHSVVRENVFYQNAAMAVAASAAFINLDHNVIAASPTGFFKEYIQTAPMRCNAFFGNGQDANWPIVGLEGNTTFDGPVDLGPAIAAGCFDAGADPAKLGWGSFAGAFGEAFEQGLGGP